MAGEKALTINNYPIQLGFYGSRPESGSDQMEAREFPPSCAAGRRREECMGRPADGFTDTPMGCAGVREIAESRGRLEPQNLRPEEEWAEALFHFYSNAARYSKTDSL